MYIYHVYILNACIISYLYTLAHTSVCVLILLYMCPHTSVCVLILLHVSSNYFMRRMLLYVAYATIRTYT